MAESRGFWRTVVRVQHEKIHPWIGLRNAIGVVLPLLIAYWAGSLATGLALAVGALNVSYSDTDGPYRRRLQHLIAASVIVGFAVGGGAVSAEHGSITVALTCLWAFAAGMTASVTPAIADMGILSLATMLVYAATPLRPHNAAAAGLIAFGGGLIEAGLSLLPWTLNRYAPQREALARFFAEIARSALEPAVATEAPPATIESNTAQEYLTALVDDHGVEAERYRVLLSEAERMRLSLLLIARLRARLERESGSAEQIALLDRFLQQSAEAIGDLAVSLEMRNPSVTLQEHVCALDAFAEQARGTGFSLSNSSDSLKPVSKVMAALVGQVRAAAEMTINATPAGLAQYERQEAATPWRLRAAGTVATLRANVHIRSAVFRHALRLAVCVAVAGALGQAFDLKRSYWLPMTVAIVLKPDFTSTFSRGLLRVGGTLLGLVVATGLFHIEPNAMPLQIGILGLFVFLMRGYGSANYGFFVIGITAIVVQELAMAGVAPANVMAARAVNTALGGLLALLAYGLWPTWEKSQVTEFVARLLDAYRLYFRKIRERYEDPQHAPSADTEQVRVAGRLARSNLEASMDRLTAEPRTPERILKALSAVLASSHRMVHAMMAMEALVDAGSMKAGPAFTKFANDVELTLFLLAASLRGSPVMPDHLPDLREAHRNLAQAQPESSLAAETDRVTNSLNNLSEELNSGFAQHAVL
jgi:uncharacterized membrane protein YccC